MIRYFVIYDIEINEYYSDIIRFNTGKFTEYLSLAKRFGLRESAEEKIQELPKGIYEIKTIYVNE